MGDTHLTWLHIFAVAVSVDWTSSTIIWTLSEAGGTCDSACEAEGATCNYTALASTAGSETLVNAAYSEAGVQCNSFGTNCDSSTDATACTSWGAPYLHTSV